MERKQAAMVLNGELANHHLLEFYDSSAWLKIAVDGGLRYFHLANVSPDVLIGDLDSITREERTWAEKQHTHIIQYPVEKDETDYELALQYVLEQKVEKICILAALGGRLDQTFANCFMLLDERLHGVDVRFDDGSVEVCLIRRSVHIDGQPGDIVSLLPLEPIVRGVTTQQLKYPLLDEDLYMHRTRGISNVMLSESAEICCREGNLLCIHTRQEH
jgi:thiamine pyrophosphokinase